MDKKKFHEKLMISGTFSDLQNLNSKVQRSNCNSEKNELKQASETYKDHNRFTPLLYDEQDNPTKNYFSTKQVFGDFLSKGCYS